MRTLVFTSTLLTVKRDSLCFISIQFKESSGFVKDLYSQNGVGDEQLGLCSVSNEERIFIQFKKQYDMNSLRGHEAIELLTKMLQLCECALNDANKGANSLCQCALSANCKHHCGVMVRRVKCKHSYGS